MAVIRDSDVQAWLEREADRWLANPQVMPALIPGVTEVGHRAIFPGGLPKLIPETLYAKGPKITGWEFYAIFCGVEFTTTRQVGHHR